MKAIRTDVTSGRYKTVLDPKPTGMSCIYAKQRACLLNSKDNANETCFSNIM